MRILHLLTIIIPLLGQAFIKNGIKIDKSQRPSVIRLSIAPYLGDKKPSFEQRRNWDSGSCTGTIVSKRVILTAKHCVKSYPSQITSLNSNNFRIRIYVKGEHQKDLKIQGVYKVPHGSSSDKDGKMLRMHSRFDIAAIILDEKSSKFITDELITDLSLCKVNNLDYASLTGFGLTESAWDNFKLLFNSSTKTFTEANISVDYKNSLYVLTRDNSGSSYDPQKYLSSKGSISAQGDSGGPLMNQFNELIAIHSSNSSQKNKSFSAPLRVIKNIDFLGKLIQEGLISEEKISCYDEVKNTKTIYYGIIK